VSLEPYYQDDHATIYHGDCRDILPTLKFDVIVTDPPYGINLDTDYSKLNGSTRTYEKVTGDGEPFDPRHLLVAPALLFGADHFAHLLPSGGSWHIWDKRVTASSNMLADFESWWTSWPSGPSRIFRYQWVCAVHPGAPNERISHPTVKPVPVMRHALSSAPDGTVVDPYAGSGSTLRAAKDLGRKAIGIEIEERYCEIAAKRLAQEVLPL
jgi:DNA modification methylase